MTARLRFSCDGTWPQDGRPAEACRGAISFDVDQVADAAGMIGTDVVDVDAGVDLAVERGWSTNDHGHYCPAHTARIEAALQARVAELDAGIAAAAAHAGPVELEQLLAPYRRLEVPPC